MKEYFYGIDGQPHGPVSEDALRAMQRRGTIAPDSLVWAEGMEAWTPLASALPQDSSARAVTAELSGAAEAGDTEMNHGMSQPAVSVAPCAFSGQLRPTSEMIRFGDDHVAPEYRDRYLQRMMQGVEKPTRGRVPGSFLQRLGARILDDIIMVCIVVVPALAAAAVFESDGEDLPAEVWIAFSVGFLVAGLYEIGMVVRAGATLGKMAVGVEVITMADERPGWGVSTIRCLTRFLPGFIPYVGGVYGLTNIVVALVDRPSMRAIHDRAASTQVVRSR